MKIVITVLAIFYTQISLADLLCDELQKPYGWQERACAEMASREEVRKLNTSIFVHLNSLRPEDDCVSPENYISNLLSFQNAFLTMKERQCNLQLSTSHNNFQSMPANCDVYPVKELISEIKRVDISPWDCTFPSYDELIEKSDSFKVVPSFDCNSTSAKFEQAVCANNYIAQLDIYASFLYEKIERIAPERTLYRENFFKYMDSICEGSNPFESCVTFQYHEKIDYLESLIP